MDEIIAAIDIGTFKTAVAIAEHSDIGMTIRGFGCASNEGVIRGNIANIEKAQQGVLRALSIAERQAQLKVKNLVVTYGGSRLKCVGSHGMTTIPKDRGKVCAADVARLVQTAKGIPIPADTQIIDHAVMGFRIDGHEVIDPIDIDGNKLEADVMLFISDSLVSQNLASVLDGTNTVAAHYVAMPIAAAEAVLTEEERELGAAVIDIGAGTTDVIIYKRNIPRFAAVIPYAGESVTHDLMVGLNIMRSSAEILKLKHGCAVENTIPTDKTVRIPGNGRGEQKAIKKQFIGTIMEARLEEIFLLAKQRIEEAGGDISCDILPAGIVLAGGTAHTPQIVYLAEKILKMPVRLGLPGDRLPVPDAMNTTDYHIVSGAINIAINRQKMMQQIELRHGNIETMWGKLRNWILQKL